MTASEAVAYFEKTYPGKTIMKLPEHNPSEIICEVEPASEHPEYSVAIAAIRRSERHIHHVSRETYQVLEGKLELHHDHQMEPLSEGEGYTIEPGVPHFAVGDFTLVRVESRPGWTPEDHILMS